MVSEIFPVPLLAELRFDARVPIQDRLLDSLRRCCRLLPDQRQGLNTTYDMADFALAAFARFFIGVGSFSLLVTIGFFLRFQFLDDAVQFVEA